MVFCVLDYETHMASNSLPFLYLFKEAKNDTIPTGDNMKQILIIEDDPSISEMIKEYLQLHGYTCTQAFTGLEALHALDKQGFDLILLDLMLPGISGEELITAVSRNARVIVVSAKTSVMDKVQLLQMGANDYLCKPFNMKELLARVEVQLRDPVSEKQRLQYQGWTLDLLEKHFLVEEQEIEVTSHEFKILELFMRHPRQVFSKQEIYEYAWGEEYYVADKTINVHISNIRMKLKGTGTEDYLQTVWGMGFRLQV